MRLDAFFLADAASTPGDGKFYIHGGGLSRFVVPRLPYPLGVAAFIRFEVEVADIQQAHQFRVAVLGPVGPNIRPLDFESIPESEPSLLLEGERRFMQIGLSLPLFIVRPGLYNVELYVDGNLARSIRVPLIVDELGEGN
ncbi:MAG TPA: hypothetical protein VL972_02385 [Solirubrobacteraceae bacterium]|nr:hypothetical protein [Solirubrobacteraceae bacterium]